jgi:hypothetical protein
MIFKIDGYGGNDQRQCAFNLVWLTLATQGTRSTYSHIEPVTLSFRQSQMNFDSGFYRDEVALGKAT